MTADEPQPASISRTPRGWWVWAHGTPITTSTTTTTRDAAAAAAAAALQATHPDHYPDRLPEITLVDQVDDWAPDIY